MLSLYNFAEFISNNVKENEKILFDMGSFIINNFILCSAISNKNYFITDVEFYIFSPFSNIDIDSKTGKNIVHCSNMQLENHRFYIHKIGNSYSLIQGAGIDLVFGVKAKSIYCGVLLREIVDMNSYQVIHGPQKVLKNLLNLPLLYGEFKEKFFSLAKNIETYNIFDEKSLLCIKTYKNNFNLSNDLRVNVNNNLKYRVRVKNPCNKLI